MAMLEGVITINAATGVATTKTGAVGEAFDVLDAAQSWGTLAATNPIAYAKAREQLAVLARAIAKMIAHVKTNAVVPAGIAVSTTGTAAAQTGATTAVGTVT